MNLEEYIAKLPPTEIHRIVEVEVGETEPKRYLVESVLGCLSFRIVELTETAVIPGHISLHRFAIAPVLQAVNEIMAESHKQAEEINRIADMYDEE